MEKRDWKKTLELIEGTNVFKYTIIVLVGILLLGFLFFLRGGPTGFAIFSDSGTEFNTH